MFMAEHYRSQGR